MKKISLIALAASLFLAEVGSAQFIDIDIFGSRNRDQRNSSPRNRLPDIVPGVKIQIGKDGLKVRVGARKNHWNNNRVIIGNSVDQAMSGEFGAKLIGYTMISDNGFDYDNVEIRNKEFSDAVKIKVINDGVRLDTLSIHFCNGGIESFSIGQRFAANSSTNWIDLPGRVSCIESFSVSGQGDHDGFEATVMLLGRDSLHMSKPHRNGMSHKSQFSNRRDRWNSNLGNMQMAVRSAIMGRTESGERLVGFSMLSDDNFDFDTVEVSNQGNVDEVRVRVIGDNAYIDTLSIQFCDRGSREIFRFQQNIQENDISDWIDLRGNNRCIKSFAVSGKGGRGFDESTIILTGRNRPGNDFGNSRHLGGRRFRR